VTSKPWNGDWPENIWVGDVEQKGSCVNDTEMKPKSIKSFIRSVIRTLGYDVHKVYGPEPGTDPFHDMRDLIKARPGVVIFDVGANVGQTIGYFRHSFKRAIVHSFEPDRMAFSELRHRCSGIERVCLNNFGLGAEVGTLEFNENTCSELSSFLEPGIDCGGAVARYSPTKVETIDNYCVKNNISCIDILKSDTQGFDLQVLKGAEHLLNKQRIHLVFVEITFCEMYKNAPKLDEIYGFLAGHGFSLVTFYKFYYQNGLAGWTDALFVNPGFVVVQDQFGQSSSHENVS
jgi:FkbM family methyltransferase